MTKDEALRLALEALDSKYIVNCGAWRLQQDLAIAAIKAVLPPSAQPKVIDTTEASKVCRRCGRVIGERYWYIHNCKKETT